MQPVAVLIEYDKKGKSTAYSSQTVFHNVCSEHAVLFLCLYHFVSKGATKAATPNCVSKGWDGGHRILLGDISL